MVEFKPGDVLLRFGHSCLVLGFNNNPDYNNSPAYEVFTIYAPDGSVRARPIIDPCTTRQKAYELEGWLLAEDQTIITEIKNQYKIFLLTEIIEK